MNRRKIYLRKWIAAHLTLTILIVLTTSCIGQSLMAPAVPIQPMVTEQSTMAPTVQVRPTGTETYDSPALSKTALPVAASNTYYVSRTGSNSDGRSWATAWNELDQIIWSVIQPGDTILLDGGSATCKYSVTVTNNTNTPLPAGCGMEYNTTLNIGASGTADSPITIKLADEPGRNGTARIFGSRSTPLGYCGQTSYTPSQTDEGDGIYLLGRSYVVIDGSHWSGIMVYGWTTGMTLSPEEDNHHVTLRNAEMFDNGIWLPSQEPDQPAITGSGSALLFERLILHDNGQDAFQTGYARPVNDAVFRRIWFYNQRPHPTVHDEPFNYCTHSDGIQFYGDLTHQNITIEDSLVGPGLMQGVILGDIGRINYVVVRNSLFIGYHGSVGNAGFLIKDTLAQHDGYVFYHVTVARDVGDKWWSIYAPGSEYQVYDSLFVGGREVRIGSGIKTGNFCWNIDDWSGVCSQRADPQFVDPDYAGVGAGFADFDFTITNPAIPQGTGTSITSVRQLLGDVTPPTAWISDLPPQSECSNVWLSWDGSDPAPGTGVKSFDVQISDNGGAWTNWLLETPARNGVYAGGAYSHTLGFQVRARDQVDNVGSYSTARYTSIVDTISPYEAKMSALPQSQKPPFGVTWKGADTCTPVTFDVEYRVGASPTWIRWLTTTSDTHAIFNPESPQYGQPYDFRVRVRDEAGNSTESDPVSIILAEYTLSGNIVNIRHEPMIWAQVTATGATTAESYFGRYIAYLPHEGDYDLQAARDGFGTLPPMHVLSVTNSLSGLDFVLPPYDDAIDNGDFEMADWGSWLLGGTVMPAIVSEGHTGDRAARLGGTGGPSWLRQDLSMPGELTDATLSFLVRLDDVAAGASALIVELAGTPISYTQVASTADWTHVWLPIDAAIGQAMTLTFTVANHPAVRLDEVRLGSALDGGSQVHLPVVFRAGASSE